MRRLPPILAAGALAGLLLVPTVAPASAADPAAPASRPPALIADDALAAVTDGPVEVIVAYDPAPGVAELRHAAVDARPTEAGIAAAAETYDDQKDEALDEAEADEVEVVRDYEHLPVQVVRAETREALEDLAAAPGVASISLPQTFEVDAANNLGAIKQPQAIATGATGAGTAVAVLDTGLNPNVDGNLYGTCGGGPGSAGCRIKYQVNYGDANPADTVMADVDPELHGSNVTSVVATVAPGTDIWSYGVFTFNGSQLVGGEGIVLGALNHVAENAATSHVRAVNLSLGSPTSRTNTECGSSSFASVFSTLRGAGIVPVTAAGNHAYSAGFFQSGLPDPACAPGALRVGAVWAGTGPAAQGWGGTPGNPECIDFNPVFGTPTCFSQTGPLLSVFAPGVDIAGAGHELSGTSQAAPHVAGAVAVLFSSNPSATASKVVEAITSTGPPIVDTRTNPATTRPLLDMSAAVTRLAAANVVRVSGADRIATALATSQASFPSADSAGAVVLASSQNFPDGLAGTPLAQAKSAPLLLTEPAALPSSVLTEVQRVLPPNGTVYVLGGTAAVGDPVASSLSGAGFNVQRLAGPDRYATAVAIADAIGSPSQVLLATGLNFPDALSAGVAAAKVGGVVLFTQNTTQAPATKTWLDAHPSLPVVIVGGTANGTSPGAVALVGADRYETATKVADHFFSSPTIVGLASGTVFPDALSGGAHIARLGGPILLTPPTSLSSYATSWFQAHRLGVTTVYFYGGTSAVSGNVVDQVKAATT